MKRILVAFLFAFMIISIPMPSSADTVDERYSVNMLNTPGSIGFNIRDETDSTPASHLIGARVIDPSRPNYQEVHLCESLQDPSCSNANVMYYRTLMHSCASDIDTNCVSSFWAKENGSNSVIEGREELIMPAVSPNQYKGDISQGLPNSGSSAVWTLPSVKNGSGQDRYALAFAMWGQLVKDSKGIWHQTETNSSTYFNSSNLMLSIYPIEMTTGNFGPGRYSAFQTPHGPDIGFNPVGDYSASLKCALIDSGKCALRTSFPNGFIYGAKVRISTHITGWLTNRLQQQVITYTPLETGSELSVEGEPTNVPIYDSRLPNSELAKIQIDNSTFLRPDATFGFNGFSEQARTIFERWSTIAENKAAAMPKEWFVRTLDPQNLSSADKCIKDSSTLSGGVATNAMLYEANPPRFNAETQSLEYRVTSPHFDPTGSEIKGTYHLTISSKVARCIYKFTNAPVQATISVVTAAGVANTVVSSMVEQDGWLDFQVSGFTFSSPVVSIKLKQTIPEPVASVTPAPTPTITPMVPLIPNPAPTVVKASPKVIVLMCVKTTKGIVKKLKVSGVKPACPSGYKKAS